MGKVDFISMIEDIKGLFTWQIDTKGCIRGHRDGKEFCPLTALYYSKTKEHLRESQWNEIYDVFNIDYNEALKIVAAADNMVWNKDDLELRKIFEAILITGRENGNGNDILR